MVRNFSFVVFTNSTFLALSRARLAGYFNSFKYEWRPHYLFTETDTKKWCRSNHFIMIEDEKLTKLQVKENPGLTSDKIHTVSIIRSRQNFVQKRGAGKVDHQSWSHHFLYRLCYRLRKHLEISLPLLQNGIGNSFYPSFVDQIPCLSYNKYTERRAMWRICWIFRNVHYPKVCKVLQ